MMATSTLRQVLTMFEEATTPLSIKALARSLQISPAQAENMLAYWIRKGRIRETADGANCGTCGANGSCPFVINLPRSYELVNDAIVIPLQSIGSTCQHHEKK